MTPTEGLAAAMIGYLVGGVPFGYLIGKRKFGVDIRTQGSGNVGATNLARSFGWRPWGFSCLALDLAKGFLPTLVFLLKFGESAAVVAGIAAVAGHMYPVWLKGRGGKGVATATGIFLALTPFQLFYAFVIFLVVGPVATRTISAGAVTAAFFLMWMIVSAYSSLVAWLAVLVCGFVIYRHKENIVRLYHGTENRIWTGRA